MVTRGEKTDLYSESSFQTTSDSVEPVNLLAVLVGNSHRFRRTKEGSSIRKIRPENRDELGWRVCQFDRAKCALQNC